MEMKVGVILSEAKDLQFRSGEQMQILRFAQNDRAFRFSHTLLEFPAGFGHESPFSFMIQSLERILRRQPMD